MFPFTKHINIFYIETTSSFFFIDVLEFGSIEARANIRWYRLYSNFLYE